MLLFLLACTETSLNRPNAVALGDGLIHVSDFHHQRIVTFDETGRFVSTTGRRGLSGNGLWEVWGLLVDGPDLHVLNVRPTSRQDETTVIEVKTFRDGDVVSVTPLQPPEGSDWSWSDGLAHTEHGWMVASLDDNALLSFEESGALDQQITRPAGGTTLQTPSGIHGEPDGVWVIEQFSNRIRHLTVNGRELMSFGEEGSEPGQLRFPKALDVCSRDGWLAVADLGNYRVQRFDLQGNFIDGFEPPERDHDYPLQLMDLALNGDCSRMALVDSKGDRVLVADKDGTIYGELSTW